MKRALTVTTINGSDNPCLRVLAEGASQAQIPFYIAGDTKTPEPFALPGVTYLSLEEQARLFPNLCALLPTKHYTRKNVAYLAAIRGGADEIQETDDDNYPRTDFWTTSTATKLLVNTVRGRPWVNVYGVYSSQRVWPRGLPLEFVHNSRAHVEVPTHERKPLILQGLADDNPDVDAVFRLTCDLPLSFEKHGPVFVEPGSWCPFNSQNTIFQRAAFPLLYLPSNCSFRMTDIWRSFVAQRCLWEMEEGVIFHQATVYQERNDHRLLRDFEDEIPGYLHNEKIRVALEACRLDSADMPRNLMICYEALTAQGFVGKDELPLVRAWLSALES